MDDIEKATGKNGGSKDDPASNSSNDDGGNSPPPPTAAAAPRRTVGPPPSIAEATGCGELIRRGFANLKRSCVIEITSQRNVFNGMVFARVVGLGLSMATAIIMSKCWHDAVFSSHGAGEKPEWAMKLIFAIATAGCFQMGIHLILLAVRMMHIGTGIYKLAYVFDILFLFALVVSTYAAHELFQIFTLTTVGDQYHGIDTVTEDTSIRDSNFQFREVLASDTRSYYGEYDGAKGAKWMKAVFAMNCMNLLVFFAASCYSAQTSKKLSGIQDETVTTCTAAGTDTTTIWLEEPLELRQKHVPGWAWNVENIRLYFKARKEAKRRAAAEAAEAARAEVARVEAEKTAEDTPADDDRAAEDRAAADRAAAAVGGRT